MELFYHLDDDGYDGDDDGDDDGVGGLRPVGHVSLI